jgi:hypothetical protein
MKVNTANSKPSRPCRRFREDSMQRAYWLIASVMIAGCAGCTPSAPGGAGGSLPTPRATDVGTPSGSPVEKTIGPAGGALASADDLLTIEVPAGALPADTQLGIQPLTSTAPNGLGSGFRLTPAGTTFSSPVTLTFKPTTEQLAGTVLALTGIGFQDASGVWRWMRGVERDEANGLVSVATTHFSDWSLLAGAQLRPPSASVRTGETLTLTAVECWTWEEEQQLAPMPGQEPDDPRFDCDDTGDLAPMPLNLSNWAVNGITGGNGSVGTISGPGVTGTYRAPSEQPEPNTVAVSVDLSNLKFGDETFPKAILVSNVTIIDAGEVQTWRGPVTFSWSEVDAFSTTSWQAEGTVEFGQPYDNGTHLSFGTPTNGSPCQISNYRREYTAWVDTCIGNAASTAGSILGTLVIRKSPSEHGLTLVFAGMVPSTCTNQSNSIQVEQNPSAQFGHDNDEYGNPIGCGGMKFTPSPPDARSLTGSATWSCTRSDSSSYTATLTWSLTGS